MTTRDATMALNRMNLRSALIAPHYNGFMQDMRQLAAADTSLEEDEWNKRRKNELCQAYGFEGSAADKPFAFFNGIAIIPIHGTLINRFSYSFGYVTGYNFIRTQLVAALADPDVAGIAFDVNSCGGEASGCFELADDIFLARGQKPMVAIVDSNCYSAAYALASAADTIIVTPSGGAGSIGVVAMHIDMSKMLADFGYKITFIYAGDHKVDGNPYEALAPDVKASIQADVDASRDEFVALVAQNRAMDSQKVLDTQAQIYRASDALSLGLIDQVTKPSEAVTSFFNELSGSDEIDDVDNPSQEQEMENDQVQLTAEKEASIRKEAAAAERTRMLGITGCDEAKDKAKLAAHLASTDMSVEDAKKILAAAAPEKAAEVTSPVEQKADAEPNAFTKAMNSGDNPGVGAGAGKTEENADSPQAKTARLLAAHKAATGGFAPAKA